MGLFDIFKKRKVKKETAREPENREFNESALNDRQARMTFLETNCEIIAAADRHILEARKEYEVVTGYLSDIQKIDAAKPSNFSLG